MKTKLFAAALLFLAALLIRPASAQNNDPVTRTIDQTYRIDSFGDAEVGISFQYGAAQWAQWKEQFGNHPDVLLRNLRYELAVAVLEDFTLDRNDVERRASATLKARALCRYRSAGEFALDIPKEMKLVNGSGKEWIFSMTSAPGNGELVNQTIRAQLPADASEVRLMPNGDMQQLVYTLPAVAGHKGLLHGGAITLLIVGAAMVAAGRIRRRLPAGMPAIPML